MCHKVHSSCQPCLAHLLLAHWQTSILTTVLLQLLLPPNHATPPACLQERCVLAAPPSEPGAAYAVCMLPAFASRRLALADMSPCMCQLRLAVHSITQCTAALVLTPWLAACSLCCSACCCRPTAVDLHVLLVARLYQGMHVGHVHDRPPVQRQQQK
jgi:hypothetical protein